MPSAASAEILFGTPDCMLDRETRVADATDAATDADRVGKFQLPAKIAVDTSHDGTVIGFAVHLFEAQSAHVFDACRFEPAEIDRVVDVAEHVHVGPLDGPIEQDTELIGGEGGIHRLRLESVPNYKMNSEKRFEDGVFSVFLRLNLSSSNLR